MIILYKYYANVKNCENFKDFGYIYIYKIKFNRVKWHVILTNVLNINILIMRFHSCMYSKKFHYKT